MEFSVLLNCSTTVDKLNKLIYKTQSVVNLKYKLSLRSLNENYCLQVNKFVNTYQFKYNLLHNPPEILKLYVKTEILEGKVTLTVSLQCNEWLTKT